MGCVLFLALVAAALPQAPNILADGSVRTGAWARVFNSGGQGLNIRSCASLDCARVGGANDGTVVYIDGGPVNASNYKWWHIRDRGWAADNWLTFDHADSGGGGGGGGSGGSTVTMPSGVTQCATEGGHCTFLSSADVWYGGNNKGVTRSFSNGVDCNNGVFGDPIPGVQKACWYKITGTNAGISNAWQCANEGGMCSFAGTGQVWYGTTGRGVTGTFTGAVSCTNGIFGDPAPGSGKSCWTNAAAPAPGNFVLASDLQVSPSDPFINDEVTSSFNVTNTGTTQKCAPDFGVKGRVSADDADVSFDWAHGFCVDPGQTRTHTSTRRFDRAGDHWFTPNFRSDGTNWQDIKWADGRTSYRHITVKQRPPGRLIIIEPLALAKSSYYPGDDVSLHYRIRNDGGTELCADNLGVTIHGPNNTKLDMGWRTNICIGPGQEYAYDYAPTFSTLGAYWMRPNFQVRSGGWDDIKWANGTLNQADFTVVAMPPPRPASIRVLAGPTFTIVEGLTVRGCVTVANDGELSFSAPYFGIGGRGPGGERDLQDFDLRLSGRDTLISGGQQYDYCAQRRFSAAGMYRFYVTYSKSGVDVPEAWTHLTADHGFMITGQAPPGSTDRNSLETTLWPERGKYFRLGDEAVVRAGNALRYPAYSKTLAAGTVVRIKGGPRYSDGFEWWDLSEEEWGGGTGWFAVRSQDPPPVVAAVSGGPALVLVQAIVLSETSVPIGADVAAHTAIRNIGDSAIYIRSFLISGHGPSGGHETIDFPPTSSFTLGPGEDFVHTSAPRAFDRTGSYRFSAVFRDSQGGWHTVPPAGSVSAQASLSVLAAAPDRPSESQLLSTYRQHLQQNGRFIFWQLPTLPSAGRVFAFVQESTRKAEISLQTQLDQNYRDLVGGAYIKRVSATIDKEAKARGIEQSTLAAVLRHEDAGKEHALSSLFADWPERLLLEYYRASMSIGPGQMKIFRAVELEVLEKMPKSKDSDTRIKALLNEVTAVSYVAAELQYLSEQLSLDSSFRGLNHEQKQRVLVIGYNLGWTDDPSMGGSGSALRDSIKKYGIDFVISDSLYDDQVINGYANWKSKQ